MPRQLSPDRFRSDAANQANIAAPFAMLWRANLIAAACRK
jgi:hypothetical protein